MAFNWDTDLDLFYVLSDPGESSSCMDRCDRPDHEPLVILRLAYLCLTQMGEVLLSAEKRVISVLLGRECGSVHHGWTQQLDRVTDGWLFSESRQIGWHAWSAGHE